MEKIIMTKEDFTEKLYQDQIAYKEREKQKLVSKMVPVEQKAIKVNASKVDKVGAKKEKTDIGLMLSKVLGSEFEIKTSATGEILVRGLNADYAIKITQKKDRLSDF